MSKIETMRVWDKDVVSDLSVLVGRTMATVTATHDELHMAGEDGTLVRLYHDQDCCESVQIEDIAGDLADLAGTPLLMAEEVVSDDEPKKGEYDESWTWTFYKFGTAKGYVTVRWYGTSNGYYGEGVDVAIALPVPEGGKNE